MVVGDLHEKPVHPPTVQDMAVASGPVLGEPVTRGWAPVEVAFGPLPWAALGTGLAAALGGAL